MQTKTTLLILTILFLLAGLFGLLAYNRFSEPVAIHWNASGQADGFGSRFEASFLLPLVALGVTLMMLALPAIDPLKANIAAFRRVYNIFMLAFATFMLYLHGLTILYNLSIITNLNRLMTPAFGLFIFFAGFLVSRARRNYFIGIRTPWTLNSEWVWDQTHRRGGLLLKIAGLIGLLGVFFPGASMYLLMIPIFAFTLYITVYSYLLHRREQAMVSRETQG